MKINVIKKVTAFTVAAVFSVFGFVPVHADEYIEYQLEVEKAAKQGATSEEAHAQARETTGYNYSPETGTIVEENNTVENNTKAAVEDNEDYNEDYDNEDYDDEDEEYENGWYEDEDGNTWYYEDGVWYYYDEETGELYPEDYNDDDDDVMQPYDWDKFYEVFEELFGWDFDNPAAVEFWMTFINTGFFPGQEAYYTTNDEDYDDEDEDWDDEDEDEDWEEEEDDGVIAAQNNKFFKNLARLEKKMAQQKYATCVENGEVETGDETNVLGAVAVMIFTVMVAYAVSRKEQ